MCAAALALAQEHKQRGYQAHALHLLGEIAGYHKSLEVEQANAYYSQALVLAQELGCAARSPLSPGSWHSICHNWPAGAGPYRSYDGHRRCTIYGYALLAPPDRSWHWRRWRGSKVLWPCWHSACSSLMGDRAPRLPWTIRQQCQAHGCKPVMSLKELA